MIDRDTCEPLRLSRRELLAGLAAATVTWGAGRAGAAPGLRLDHFNFRRIDGEGLESLSAAYAGRPVLLNVWATWCAPCRYEMPALQRLAERLEPAGFAVLGVAIDRDPLRVRQHLRGTGIRFARHLDPDGEALRRFVSVDAVPLNLLFGAEGTLRWSEAGLRDWDAPAMGEWLRVKAGN